MIPPKVVVYGNTCIPADRLNALRSNQIELTPIPENYPADRLDYLAPFNLILLNSSIESEENLERIRALRRNYGTIPVIMASDNPSAYYLVQAYRYGITDCLLAPFNEDQLAFVVSAYLKSPDQQANTLLRFVPEIFNFPVSFTAPNKVADFHIQFLGTFRMNQQGARLNLPGGARQRSLLAYLLFHAKSPLHRDRIIEYFWPDHDPDCAKNNLNVGISNLRRFLEKYTKEDVICFRNESFFLNPELRFHSDLDEFLQAYHAGKNAECKGQEPEALKWYHSAVQMGSTFLEEFHQEDWTLRPRDEFTEKYLHALDYLSWCRQKERNFESAIEMLRLMLYKDDCLESAHRKIMECYLAMGKKEKTVRQYLECERILSEKLDMRPSAETQTVYQRAKMG